MSCYTGIRLHDMFAFQLNQAITVSLILAMSSSGDWHHYRTQNNQTTYEKEDREIVDHGYNRKVKDLGLGVVKPGEKST